MSKVCPLFSSSSGNSVYIGSASGAVLVDAGASASMLFSAISDSELDSDHISAVLVTHEHSDHIKGLKPVLRKTGAVLAASETTLETLARLNAIPPETPCVCLSDGDAEFSGIKVHRFATSHDCEGSSGYSATLPDGRRVAVCTDLGIVTDDIRNSLSGCDLVVFESNHDLEMLRRGPYPPYLKLRIMSDHGHLSNNSCAAELPALLNGGTTRFVLAHLSEKNNIPMLAANCARAALLDGGARENTDYILQVAPPCGGEVIYL